MADQKQKPDHSPVSLPAGSYERGALQSGLDAAVDRNASNRTNEVQKALDKARVDPVGKARDRDPSLLPDHKLVEVPLKVDEDGKATQTETIQVFDPSRADRHVPAQQPVLPSRKDADAIETARTTAVKSKDEAEPVVLEPAPTPSTVSADAATDAAATAATTDTAASKGARK